MNIPDAKAAVEKRMGQAEVNSSFEAGQGLQQKGAYSRSTKKQKQSPICITQKYKGRVVLRGGIVKDDSGACAVFTEQESSASQMTAAKVLDVIARLLGGDTQAKLEDAPRLLGIPESGCPDFWTRFFRQKMAKIMVKH